MQSVLTLPAELSIYTVTELRLQWLAWLNASHDAAPGPDAGSEHRVDASAVEEIDAAGVQLLMALSNEASQQRRVLRLVQPSGPLATACAALGLADWLAGLQRGAT